MSKEIRKTDQYLLPVIKEQEPDSYDIYPTHALPAGCIREGYSELASLMCKHSVVLIDGYTGVFYENIVLSLKEILNQKGKKTACINIADYLRSEKEIDLLIKPFMGGEDPLFGKRTTLLLHDFFNFNEADFCCNANVDITLIYGPGAFLTGLEGLYVYIDLPKNELQFRARANQALPLGATSAPDYKQLYKRFYFIDWIVLNKHKAEYLNRIHVVADGQRPDAFTWMLQRDLMTSLQQLSTSQFRVRPWFEPGAWGGQWIKKHIKGLNQSVINYAWSFELIVPENGLILESSGLMLEVSFDFLMYCAHKNVLGKHAGPFGFEFPIRFDFLDTFDGGNLSIQCHPQQEYFKHHFGENFTQEEAYYILDAAPDAKCYLGFQENIQPATFENALVSSFQNKTPVAVTDYVQMHASARHDFFLIPPGTIHGSGINNLVLEISTTPYIFTFKMYDWLRLDLDGKPRTLNIERAMSNLRFDRKGSKVRQEHISIPALTDRGDGWEKYHLPTHAEHSYDVFRYHIQREATVHTNDVCHVLSLVEGESITVKTGSIQKTYHYAETFVIPSAAGQYTIINNGSTEVMVVVAFMK